jgi:predicted phosphodiesterase
LRKCILCLALVSAPQGCKPHSAASHQNPVKIESPTTGIGQTSAPAVEPVTPSQALTGQKPTLRVALVGDQGIGQRARAVLDLIRSESADLLVILGDFDYENKPSEWGQMLNQLGNDFPWFAVIGNHDIQSWSAYEAIIAQKQGSISGAQCRGKPGLQASCLYRGVQLIMSEIGTKGDRVQEEDFIRRELAQSQVTWKFCLWHKTQHDMQTGAKTDEVGWTAYQSCQSAGAIIATGHEHAYARTKTLTALGDAASGYGAVGESNAVEVGPGRTFLAVAGMGGIQLRVFVPSHEKDTWWGAYYTADRESVNGQVKTVDNSSDGMGALFLDLGIAGDQMQGRGRFVTAVKRRVVDDFSIRFVRK